jgi:hypothetical protein
MSTSLDQLKASGTVVVSDSGQSEEKKCHPFDARLLIQSCCLILLLVLTRLSGSSVNSHVFARNLDVVQTSVSRLISLPRNRLRNARFACGATGDFESESYHTPCYRSCSPPLSPFLFLSPGRYFVSLHPFLGTANSSLSFTLVAIFFAGLASRENIDMWREKAVETSAQDLD